jgi:hypothetical protein
MHSRFARFAAVAGFALLLSGSPVAAQLSRAELRSELAQRYRAALANPALLASAPVRYDFAGNGPAIDRFLQAMPLSPLEFLKQDMAARRYEVAIPRFLADAHLRWVELHADDARALYGDAAVDALLSRRQLDGQPAVTGAAISDAAAVGTNRNVAATDVPPPDGFDGEIQIAVNPSNHNQVVAAANTWGTAGAACDFKQTQSVFYSSDGGASWSYTCAPSNNVMSLGTCTGTVFGSDPALFWNDNDEVFLDYMLICYNGNYKYAMVVARSTNGGATWSKQGVVKNSWSTTDLEDKNFYAIDTTPASPYYGRHYTCWDRNNDEKFAYSSTNGASWTEVDLPAAASGTYDLACEIAVGKNGTVHVVFDTLNCPLSGPCSNERMFYTRSTNGGASWSAPVLVRDFNLVGFSNGNYPDAQDDRGINPFGAIEIDNSGGACDGNLYATFSDFASGSVADNDVWLSRSTDNGATWSAPLRVNDGGVAGRTQFHPFLQVDPASGNVVVAWHDARNDSNNRKVDFYAARSTDCGVSFEPNVKVSANSAEFNNSGISTSDENSKDNVKFNPNQYGEYLGLDVEGGKAYVAWTDTRHYYPGSTNESQAENVGFALVDWSGAGAVCGNNLIESPEVCDGSDLGGQTCLSKGFTGGTLACNGSCSAFDTSSCTGGGTPVTKTFTSIAAQDGFVREKSETAKVGGYVLATDATAGAIRVGDDSSDRQQKGFVSFDTSSIPDGATVTAVTLRLKRGKVQGTNPFSLLGAMSADVANAFGGNVALASGDFQAAATATAVCTLSNATTNGSWSTCAFNTAGRAAINRTGKTQVRVAFAKDDNDDLGADWIGYFSGDNSTAANRPQLVVTYQ